MISSALILLVGLQVKHFIADYLLQNPWMIAGKRSLFAPGGYAHAGVHAAGTAPVLLAFAVPLTLLMAILLAEFVVHYLLDFAKAHYGDGISSTDEPKKFWAANGFDQLLHQITYLAIAAVVFSAAL